MAMRQALLPEFDQEMSLTRKVLARVPEDRLSWQPHPKSMTLGRLASHLAELPGWGALTMTAGSFDVAPEGKPFVAANFQSRDEILQAFDANILKARAALEQLEDETLMQPWSLLRAGATVFTMPRAAVLRGMVFSHIIHHRAQLTVYLRLNDVPVPSIYGPSADEQ